MKISASIYSSSNDNLTDIVQLLDAHGVEKLHVDCNDNPSVFDDIARIRTVSSTPLDVHIISDTPEKYFDAIVQHRPEFVAFQYENLPPNFVFPPLPCALGLALTSDTPIEVFEKFAAQCQFVLIMTTTPGQSGGVFNQQNFQKIRAFRKAFPMHQIEVDGGVNDEISFILRNLQVESAVVGSYLFKGNWLGNQLLSIRQRSTGSGIPIGHFMMPLSDVPTLSLENISFEKILTTIDNFKMGVVCLTDTEQNLLGIVTNADIRKGLIRHIGNLDSIRPEELINAQPITLKTENTVHELLQLVHQLSFPLLFLPIVDEKNRLCGALTFNQLIQSES